MNYMPYKKQQDFLEEIDTEFGINKDTFRCYTLESNPQIKLILFGKTEWKDCHIGFLINGHFHVIGLEQFSCINEDVKALYVPLKNSLPTDELRLKMGLYDLFTDEEQQDIINKLKEIFQKQ